MALLVVRSPKRNGGKIVCLFISDCISVFIAVCLTDLLCVCVYLSLLSLANSKCMFLVAKSNSIRGFVRPSVRGSVRGWVRNPFLENRKFE